MGTESSVLSFIEKLLTDDDFHKRIVAARDFADFQHICKDAGFYGHLTKDELDAELLRLKQAAGLLVPLERAIFPNEKDTHAQWVSRLAGIDTATQCQTNTVG